MIKVNKKYYIIILLLLIIYSLFAKEMYINKLKKTEFPKIISGIEANLNSIADPYTKVEKAIRDSGYIKTWLNNPEKDSKEIVTYLTNLTNTYDLEHASVVDDKSLTYYGSDKIILLDESNKERDGWYFDYRLSSSAKSGDSVFYIDQIYPKILTIFINIPILDSQDNYIGVAGGGFYYKNFNSYLNQLERLYNVDLFLIKDNEIKYSNKGVDSGSDYEEIDQYKYLPNGIFLDNAEDNSLTYIKYLSKWDSYLIVKRSAKQIFKELLFEIVNALIFIIIITVIILIINSHKFVKNKWKERESKSTKEALYLTKKITGIINQKINYYQNKQYLKGEITSLLQFEDMYIALAYDVITNKNINLNEYCNITKVVKNIIYLELPGLLLTDLKIDLRLVNEPVFINIDKSKFTILLKTLIVLLFHEAKYKELIVYQEVYKNRVAVNLVINNSTSTEILYRTENIFKKLFSSINIKYVKVLNSSGYEKTEIVRLVFEN